MTQKRWRRCLYWVKKEVIGSGFAETKRAPSIRGDHHEDVHMESHQGKRLAWDD